MKYKLLIRKCVRCILCHISLHSLGKAMQKRWLRKHKNAINSSGKQVERMKCNGWIGTKKGHRSNNGRWLQFLLRRVLVNCQEIFGFNLILTLATRMQLLVAHLKFSVKRPIKVSTWLGKFTELDRNSRQVDEVDGQFRESEDKNDNWLWACVHNDGLPFANHKLRCFWITFQNLFVWKVVFSRW